MKKVFICWSGVRAKHVAQGLFKWLPDVLQNVDPWMSAESVAAGARFSREVEQRLEATDFGILCITPENTGAPWIHFEAGALSKRVDASRVVPYLIGMRAFVEVPEGPLTRFQGKVALTESLDVLRSLNEAMGDEGLPSDRLERAFKRCWPDLEAILKTVPQPETSVRAPDTAAVMSEILETVRDLARRTPQFTRSEIDAATLPSARGNRLHELLSADIRLRQANISVLKMEGLVDGRWHLIYATPSGPNYVVMKAGAGPTVTEFRENAVSTILADARRHGAIPAVPIEPPVGVSSIAATHPPDQRLSGET